MAKLKVFTWSDGFHAYTVAVTSRAKALAAWGVTRDLFKDGDASEITSGADHDAALAEAGTIVRRGVKVDIGKVEAVPKPRAANKAELARVAELERDLAKLTAVRDTAVSQIASRRARLDAEADGLERTFRDRADAIADALSKARRKLQT